MKRALATVMAAAAALALGGCITLFPKEKATALYAFGDDFPPAAQGVSNAPPFSVLRTPTSFDAAAAGDGILTRNGEQVAYIAHSGWVAPAAQLFEEAEKRAFDAGGGPARLTARGQLVTSDAELRLTVGSFEARYLNGMDAPPTVVVTVQASLTSLTNHQQPPAERTFEVQKLAAANRVGAIVSAFDAATVEALDDIVAWTDAEGASAAAPAPSGSPPNG